ncbi:hypothetical protein DL98DRAFT_515015 [Cadophora sp. DSE1049]|nr:hypothetical protein DL98DRAFT_515015 [Cadophora sp. DSE1049]
MLKMPILFSIPTIMTILLFIHAIQATNNTEPSSNRIVPVFSTKGEAYNQISKSDNQSSSADAQATYVNCPSEKPSCEATDCDGDKTEFRCQATGPLQTCPCCPQSQLPSCESPICMAQPLVLLCTTALLQDCPCDVYFEPISPLLQPTDEPFSTDEELREVQLEYMKLFEERPELRPGSKEWYEKMKREGRLEGEDALDGSGPECGRRGALGLAWEPLQRGVFVVSSGGSLLLSLGE